MHILHSKFNMVDIRISGRGWTYSKCQHEEKDSKANENQSDDQEHSKHMLGSEYWSARWDLLLKPLVTCGRNQVSFSGPQRICHS